MHPKSPDVNSFPLAKKIQQHDEHVDEIEIERQGAHYRRFAEPLAVATESMPDVLILDRLRIVCRQCREYAHSND